MSTLLDTNILTRAAQPGHSMHTAAFRRPGGTQQLLFE